MQIKNVEGIPDKELIQEIERGGQFVHFYYTVSLLFVTFHRQSPPYFIRSGERPVRHHLSYTALSFLLGWWGIPFGPLRTWQTIKCNMNGGKNVTNEVVAVIAGYVLFEEINGHKKH